MMFFKIFQKNIRIYVALSGISISIIGIVTWFVLPYIINKVVDWNVLLYEDSDQFQRWKILPQPMEFKVFIFNVTNPDEIHKGALPIVKEIGPYIYNQYRVKKVEDISKDKTTITYTSKQIFIFDKKRSYPHKEDDKIVVLNVAMNVVFQIKNVELKRIVEKLMSSINNSAEELPVISTVKHFIEIVSGNRKGILQVAEEIIESQLGFVNTNLFRMFKNEKSLFLRTTPRNYFFDGIPFCLSSDTIIRFLCRIVKDIVQQRKIKAIYEMKDGSFEFAFFRYKNNTHDGTYKIYSGINDSSLTTKILTWDGRPHLTVWNNETTSISSCNLIGKKSTDGVLFSPHVKPEASVFAFSTDVCRTVELFYQKPIIYQGINGYRFVTGDNFLNKIGSKYSTKCYCSRNLGKIPKYDDGCLYKGVMDVSVCHALSYTHDHPKNETNQGFYALTGIFYVLGKVTSHKSLQWVPYPTQVVGKSCKPIPVMVFGVLLGRKKYTFRKVIFVLMIVCGVTLFIFKDKYDEKDGENPLLGNTFIGISLLMDGLCGATEDRMRSVSKPATLNFMMFMNIWASLFLVIGIVVFGEAPKFWEFVTKHPEICQYFGIGVLVASFGQIFISSMIANFGPLALSLTTTTRKFFSVCLSVMLFGNVLSYRQWGAAIVIFAALFLDAWFNKRRVNEVTETPLDIPPNTNQEIEGSVIDTKC